METLKFTKAAIAAIIPDPNKRLEFADSVLPGLRLRVTSSGAKSFCVARYRENKFIRVTLGKFPDLTVDQAREMAARTLGEVATTRQNPNERRREEKNKSITLVDALAEYIKSREQRIKQTTIDQYQGILNNFSGDWLKTPLAAIDRERVESRHKAITDGGVWFGDKPRRSGVATGSKAQADLWARVLRAVYRYAHDHYRDSEGNRLLPDPPTMVLSTKRKWHGTTRKTSRIRNNELSRWLEAVDIVRQQSASARDDFAVAVCDALDVALFTGLRRAEVFGLEWSRVNMLGRYFWIDETKNGDPLELPITDTLYAIFDRRKAVRANDVAYVFPSTNGGVVSDPRRVIDQIIQATTHNGVETKISFTCHDARRTFGSVAELAGVGSYILKRLMNHRTFRSADVTQGYLHFSADELMAPAQKVERAILEHAGRVEKSSDLDDLLLSVVGKLTDEEKRKVILSLLNQKKEKDK
ncbi:tyrosine-type recombinase/integrase [Klebsiella pneumoniae subsp. pneumoniae]|uniref:site-specific integrase n=1 Tax=Klebsiella pneumoniae TaxID=573 RepID=UPI000E350160|nr:site-specific integrase [Klebsiella pneumoniae]HBT3336667.1 site-specific integrase [Klebsiella pneumoniae]HBV0935807.1 site-specific integrase [Klebsiella pneumoniae]